MPRIMRTKPCGMRDITNASREALLALSRAEKRSLRGRFCFVRQMAVARHFSPLEPHAKNMNLPTQSEIKNFNALSMLQGFRQEL